MNDGFLLDVLSCYLHGVTKPLPRYNNMTKKEYYEMSDESLLFECVTYFYPRYHVPDIHFFKRSYEYIEEVYDIIGDMTLQEVEDYVTMLSV